MPMAALRHTRLVTGTRSPARALEPAPGAGAIHQGCGSAPMALDIGTAYAKATFTSGPRIVLYRDLLSLMARGASSEGALATLATEPGPVGHAAAAWGRRMTGARR